MEKRVIPCNPSPLFRRYREWSMSCTPCPKTRFSSDGLNCVACAAGLQPNTCGPAAARPAVTPSPNHDSTQFPSTRWSVPFGVRGLEYCGVFKTLADARDGSRNSRS